MADVQVERLRQPLLAAVSQELAVKIEILLSTGAFPGMGYKIQRLTATESILIRY
jgi:hypothetical protein